jgi:hypothetical protein
VSENSLIFFKKSTIDFEMGIKIIIFNNNLKIDLMQYKIYPSIGRPRNTEWEAEESFFVLNINEQEAINLGIKFKQNAIVYGYVNCEPKLLKLI